MSTNTESEKGPVLEKPQSAKEGGLSFIKEKFGLYIIIFLGIYALGRAISRGARGELWSQGIRNMISIGAFLILLGAGLIDAQIIFLVLILYIPFVDALPGRFGGGYTALNYFNILSGMTMLCWFADKVKKNRVFLVTNRATKYAVLFICLSLTSYVVNGFGYGTEYLKSMLLSIKRWLDPVIIFFIASGMTYRRDLRRDVIVAVLLGTAMVIFLAIKDIGQVTHFDETRRISGVGEQPNMLGAFVVDYMFLFLGILLVNLRKKIYWFAIIPLLWGVRTIALAFSRGAYLSFVVATLAITFIRNKALFFICVMIFVFIASNLWVLPEAVRERIEMTVSGEQLYGYGKEIEPSAAGRVEAWKATISLVMGRPFLGYGLGMVGTYLGYYAGLAIGDVHNSYLLLAAEYGLVTLLVFLATIFAGIRVSWYVYNNSRDEILKGAALGFMVGILGLMVNCFFGSHMTTLWEIGYFWVLLAVFANEEKELRSEIAGLAQA